MHIDPSTVSNAALAIASVTGVISIIGWNIAARRKRVIGMMSGFQQWQAGEIKRLTSEVFTLQTSANAAQAQRVAASRRAAELNRQRAAERRQERVETTAAALSETQIPPRSEVVAGVRDERPRRNSGAGQVAATQGG